MAIPQRQRVSPWPFVAMIGMAVVFFLDGAAAAVAPWWGVAGLFLVWLLLFVRTCRWWSDRPRATVALPVLAAVVWYVALAAGAAWLGWG